MARRAPGDSHYLSPLAAFVPRYLRHAAMQSGEPLGHGRQERGCGALLFIDISGFTAMTESLAEQGPRGAEQMSELLNRHYGRLADHIDDFDGDVIAFAGDAVLAFWWVQDADKLSAAVHAAARCALRVQHAPPADDGLQIRLSVGAGDLRRYQLGGIGGRWHWLVTGDPIIQVSQLDAQGRTGQIVLSRQAASMLEHANLDEPSPGVIRLNALDAIGPAPSQAAPRLPAGAAAWAQATDIDAFLEAFTPEVVAERLAAGQDAFLAEYRRVTVAFVKFDDYDSATPLEVLQRTMATVQRSLERYHGLLYQCLHDDKGLIFILAFGMPPRTHEEDSERALLTALDIRSSLASRRVSIGVACGRVFCGAYGGRTRKQFSLIGSTINLAARLMVASDGGVLCNSTCAETARHHLTFRDGPAIKVKGRSEAVPVFVPLGRRLRTDSVAPARIVGRAEELELLTRDLELLAAGNGDSKPGPTLIEAEAGMGKSTLAAAAMVRAGELGIRVLAGRADAIESGTPHYPFREIAEKLIGKPDSAALNALLAGSAMHKLLPLLHTVLPQSNLPAQSEATQSLRAAARLEKTNLLLLEILARGTNGAATLIVLEDCHWIDSASWSLLLALTGAMPHVAVIATSRPMEVPPPEYRDLLGNTQLRHMRLQSLDDESLLALVAARLGVRTLPEALAELLLERAEGNPFFAEELAFSLRDSGRIVIRDGRVQTTSDSVFDTANVPETLQGAITSRVDLLEAPVQLTAKVASVIGRGFDAQTLSGIYPALPHTADRCREQQIAGHLAALASADLIVPEPHAGSYVFRHAVTRDTVYALLSYAQRRELHSRAARYLEAHFPRQRESMLPRLAHHYAEAEMPAEAMSTLREAGAHAVATFANREAVGFLRRALEFQASAPEPFSRLNRISIESDLCTAHYGLTDYERTLLHAWRALRQAGHYRPDRGRTLPRAFATYLAHLIRERLSGRRAEPYGGVQRDEQLSAMQALGSALPALMLLGHDAECLEAALQLHNLGARLEPSAEAGASRCALGFCFAMMGWKASAEELLRRGLNECAASGDRQNLVHAQMLLGMYLQMRGRLLEAEGILQASMEILEQSPDPGMWHHRGKLQLASVQHALGRLEISEQTFADGGMLARKAEPQVGGLFTALRGISLMHAGRIDEAARLVADGEKHARDHDSALHSFAALGALAELELRRGNRQQALAAAMESLSISQRGGEVNSYVHGLHGYSGSMMVFCDCLLSPGEPLGTLSPTAIGKSASCASRSFAGFARRFEVAKPRQLALEGLRLHASGQSRRARRHWHEALSLADAMCQPFDSRLARYYLECAQQGKTIRAAGV